MPRALPPTPEGDARAASLPPPAERDGSAAPTTPNGSDPENSAPRLIAAACILLAAPTRSGLSAQETPPVTDDDRAVYAAAADSTAFPDESDYVLLEEGVYRIGDDGTVERTLRTVRQALTGAAAEHLGEISLGYDGSREGFELGWARVVAPDGTVRRTEPVHVQELDQPVGRNAPVYSERKVVRASLGDLEAGDIVDLRYTIRETEALLPGDVMFTWTVNGTGPIHRSRLVVDAPANFGLNIEELNLPSSGSVREADGRTVRTWSYDDIDAMEGEPFPADSNGVQEWVFVTGDLAWDDVAAWYAGLARDRYDVTPEMEAELAEVVVGAASLADSLRALQRWVAQDVRYVGVELGIGGYQPRPAGEVLATGVGDCKDKATLFLALARHMGVDAYPVLARAGRRPREGYVSIHQFNHMIAAVRDGDGWTYVDLTNPFTPWGRLPAALQGSWGVRLEDDGTGQRVDFPEAVAEENRSSIVVHGELTSEGAFDGMYEEVVTGALEEGIRREFARPLTERQRTSVEQGVAHRVFDGARTDSLVLFDGLDLTLVPRIFAAIRADSVLRTLPGGLRLLPLKLPRYGNPGVIARLEEDRPRRFPIDAEQVFGLREHHTGYRIRLPEGWTAELPGDVHADGPFGTYDSTYRQEGRDLVVVRTMRGTTGFLPPDRAGDLLRWLKTVWGDDVEEVVLRAPAPGG